MWARFQAEFRPKETDSTRLAAFRMNVASADASNAEQGEHCADLFDGDCTFGVTKFSHLFPEEFRATHLGYKHAAHEAPVLPAAAAGPASVDWRPKGVVTPVKDQGQCGSCWAFSTTEEIESAYAMKTGKLVELSTQQIISCDKVDQGCNGGDTPTAYKYVVKAGGIDTAKDYPDKSHNSGQTGKCTWDKDKAVSISGFTYATTPCKRGSCKHQDEDQMAASVAAHGPVSVCVNAGAAGWQTYKQGVFKKRCGAAVSDLDHCVQVVGYDQSGDTPYWIVRNSWNTDWGIEGYMHLAMGKNLCGIADEATIATADAGSEDVVV